MPNQEFPINQYLQAFQNKYANEQANRPDYGKIIGEGISQGGLSAYSGYLDEKKKRKEAVFGAVKDYFGTKGTFKIRNAAGKSEDVPIDQIPQIYDAMYSGDFLYKKDKDGNVVLQDKKKNPVNIFWEKTPETNTFNIPMFNQVTGEQMGTIPSTKNVAPISLKPATKIIETSEQKQQNKIDYKLATLKPKAQAEIYETVETNNLARNRIQLAREASKRITTGLGGAIKETLLSNFDANNPMLADWQLVKSVLTDNQLLQTAKTKGAISDKEMDLFAKAAANEDIKSLPKIAVELDKMFSILNTKEDAIINSYRQTFNEDPLKWENLKSNRNNFNQPPAPPQAQTIPKYTSEEEVLKNPPPKGTKILINGQEAIWE